MSIGNDRKKKSKRSNLFSVPKNYFSDHARDMARERIPLCDFSLSIRAINKKIKLGQATVRNAAGKRKEVVFEKDGYIYSIIMNKKITEVITVWRNPKSSTIN